MDSKLIRRLFTRTLPYFPEEPPPSPSGPLVPVTPARSGPITAAVGGHYVELLEYLEDGYDVNKRNHVRETALHFAAAYDNPDIVQLLLNYGAWIDVRDSEGRTPLMRAVDRQAVGACRLLIENGADVELQARDGNTILLRAAYYDHVMTMDEVISAGADLESTNNNLGWTALQLAADMGHLFIVRTLLQSGARVDNTNRSKSALILAARGGHDLCVREILKFVAGTPSDSAGAGDALYRNLKSKVSTDLNLPLFEAARNGHAECMRLLLDAGAECIVVNEDGNTALIESCRGGHTEVAELLIAAGIPLDVMNNNGKTAALIATEFGHNHIAELLYKGGASRQAVDVDGRTAYDLAAIRGNDQYVWEEIEGKRAELLKR